LVLFSLSVLFAVSANYSTGALLKLTSSLSFQVLSNVKVVILTACDFIFFGKTFNLALLFGYAITLVSAAGYTLLGTKLDLRLLKLHVRFRFVAFAVCAFCLLMKFTHAPVPWSRRLCSTNELCDLTRYRMTDNTDMFASFNVTERSTLLVTSCDVDSFQLQDTRSIQCLALTHSVLVSLSTSYLQLPFVIMLPNSTVVAPEVNELLGSWRTTVLRSSKSVAFAAQRMQDLVASTFQNVPFRTLVYLDSSGVAGSGLPALLYETLGDQGYKLAHDGPSHVFRLQRTGRTQPPEVSHWLPLSRHPQQMFCSKIPYVLC
jgi:hypothetical protein